MMEHAEHSPAAIREKAAGAVNCQSVTLPSGLTVLCRTMPGYSSVHAMYATNFGSVVREFTLNGKRIQLPAGTAHFLEHKMFESEQGDAFDLYAKTGAAANAFTSYDRTCYIFTATGMTDENLDILLNMVGHPWFTKETIAKEQGIIGQEIKMYDDSPDWRLLTALFRCLYKSHPIRDDIAGTTQSIAELTPELLYACTDAFYRPGNMVLSVAGNITLDQAVEACRRNGVYDAVEPPQVETIFPQEADTVQYKETTFTMPVNKPCFALGYKEAAINRGDTRMEVIADLLPDLICGGLTNLYRKLYDESLVNPEFSGDYLSTEGACIIAFTGESETPREVAQMVRDEIARLRQNGVDPELFTLVKNQMYGEMLADVENVDDAAEEMGMAFLKGRTLAAEGVTVDPTQPVHPTFLYESIWCLVGVVLLASHIKKRRFNGELFLLYIIWYGLGRYWIEGLRTDALMVTSTLRTSQLVALVSVATAVVLLVAGLQRFKGAQLMVPLQVSNLKKLDAAGTYFVVDELPASASHHEFVQATAAMNRRLEEFDLDEAEKVEDNSDNGEAIEEGNVVAEPQQPAEAPETPAPEDEAGE